MLVREPALAVMSAEPTVNPVAKPVFAPTTATVVLEEFQFTELLMFMLLPSAKKPVAVNCTELEVPLPLAETVAVEGEMRMDCRVELLTRTVVVAVRLPDVAVTVVVPGATPVTSPPLVMLAIALFAVLQVTDGVVVEPSALVPVALSCAVPFTTTAGLSGLTLRLVICELEEHPVRAMALMMTTAKQVRTPTRR